MMNFIAILFTLNAFVLLLNIRLSKRFSSFQNITLNLLFLVSCYAVISTQLKTIYLITLIGIPLYFYFNEVSLSYAKKSELLQHILVVNCVWLIFFILFYVLGDFQFRVSHVDYIISSRLAFYNDIFGVENTQGFYNLFSLEITNEVYHYFELWCMCLGNYFNSQGRIANYFFFVFPLIAFISIIGFKELIQTERILVAVFIFLCSIIISSPYDFLWRLLELKLPLSSLGAIILNLKLLLVFPIAIYLLKSISNKTLDNVMICLLSFYYPIIIPVLLPALILFQFIKSRFQIKSDLIIPILFTVVAGVYMLLSNPGPADIASVDFFNVKITLKILFIGFFVPIISYGLFLIVDYKSFLFDKRSVVLFLCVTNLIALCLWFALHENIDANQFISIPFSPILSILTALIIYDLVVRKMFKVVMLVCLIYGIPFAKLYSEAPFFSTPQNLKELSYNIPLGAKVLYIPLRSEVKSIFDYTERLSNPINSIFLFREDIHVINISTSFKPPFKLDNPTRTAMFQYFRSISPYFTLCKEFDEKNLDCLFSFLRKYKIDYVIAYSSLNLTSDAKLISRANELSLYYFPNEK